MSCKRVPTGAPWSRAFSRSCALTGVEGVAVPEEAEGRVRKKRRRDSAEGQQQPPDAAGAAEAVAAKAERRQKRKREEVGWCKRALTGKLGNPRVHVPPPSLLRSCYNSSALSSALIEPLPSPDTFCTCIATTTPHTTHLRLCRPKSTSLRAVRPGTTRKGAARMRRRTSPFTAHCARCQTTGATWWSATAAGSGSTQSVRG